MTLHRLLRHDRSHLLSQQPQLAVTLSTVVKVEVSVLLYDALAGTADTAAGPSDAAAEGPPAMSLGRHSAGIACHIISSMPVVESPRAFTLAVRCFVLA